MLLPLNIPKTMVNSSIYLFYPLDSEKGNRNSQKSRIQWPQKQSVFHKTGIIVTISANYCTYKTDLYNWIKTLNRRQALTAIALLISLFVCDLPGQDNPLPELTLQEAAPATVVPEDSLSELTESVLSLQEEATSPDTTSSESQPLTNEPSAQPDGPDVQEYIEPRRLRDIDLDLFENRLKLFRGFKEWDTDQVGRWARIDYLISWRRGTRTPSLATTSTAGTPIEEAGVLGLSSTSNLLGSNTLNDEATPGIRVDFGRWLPGSETGIGARFYSMFDAGSTHTFNEGVVSRPFFNVDAGENQSLPINFPGSEAGSLTVSSAAKMLGTDVYVMRPWRSSGIARINFIAGYQFSRFDESLMLRSDSTNLDGRNSIPVGTQLEVTDSFRTRNIFHGGLIGLSSDINGGDYTVSFLAKVGLGSVNHSIVTSGSSVITDPGGGTNTLEGLLVRNSNQGEFSSNRFTAIPEFSVRYTKHLNDSLDFSLGYSVIYWGHAVQPGNQVDINVDMTNTTGQPIMPFAIDHYWAQSLNMGLTFRY